MDTINGALAFDSTLDNSEVLKRLEQIKQKIVGTAQTAEFETSKINDNFKSIAAGMAGALTLTGAAQFRTKLIEVRGEFQKFEAILTNSLGSQREAAASMAMLSDVASKTPFQLDQLTASYVKLVNQGFKPSREELIKLGDLASSTGKGFDQLVEAVLDAQTGQFERLKEFGIKASASGDQIAFSFKGVTTTVQNSGAAIRDYMLSLGDLQGVKGSMKAISSTLIGQVSNLEDAITAMFNKIGSQSEGFLSDSISATKYLVDNYESVGLAIAGIVAIYGSYKAAVIVVNTLNKIQAATALLVAESNGFLVASEARMIAAKMKLIQLQNAFNASVLANPYAIVAATVMAAIVATYLVFRNKTIEVKTAMELLKGTQKDVAKGMADQKAKIEPLVETLQNLKVAEKDRLNAYNALKEINPSILEGISLQEAATSKLTERVKDYLVQAEKKIAFDIYSSKLAEAMAPQLEANDRLTELYKQQITAIMNLNQAKKQFGANSVEAVRAGGVVGGLSFQIQETIQAWKKAEETIKIIKDRMAGYVPETTVKVEPPKQDPKEKDDFDKLIEYKQKKYEEYYTWVRAFGSGSANEEFKSLLSEGKTYQEFLQKSIQSLELKKEAITASELKRLSILRGYYAQVLAEQAKAEFTPIQPKTPSGVTSQNEIKQALSAQELISKHEMRVIRQNSAEIIEMGRNELRAFMSKVKTKIDLMKAEGKNVEELEKIYKQAQGTMSVKTAEGFITASNMLSDMANYAGNVSDEFRQMISLAGNLSYNIGNAMKQLKPGGNSAAGFSSIASIIFTVGDQLDKQFGLQSRIAKEERARAQYNIDIQMILQKINYELDSYLSKLEDLKGLSKNKGFEQSFDLITASIDKAKQTLEEFQFSIANKPKDAPDVKIDLEKLEQITKASSEVEALTIALSRGLISQDQVDIAMQYIDNIKQYEKQLADIEAQYSERLTGTTENSIVDSIAKGFLNGQSSMADFADNFEELMTNALIQSFKAKALEDPIAAFYKQFAELSKDGLTETEVTQLRKMYADIIAGANVVFEGLKDVSGIDINKGNTTSSKSQNDLSGAIKGVTEETAGLIAGQMNAMRMNQSEALDITRKSLMHLANIDANTFNLFAMKRSLEEIERQFFKPNLYQLP